MVGRTLSHYRIVEKLGEGGMGVVYKARDLRLDRLVALKVLPAEKMADEDRRCRFAREARAASALNHPNIITIHDIAEQDGQTFMVMELVEGKPLTELIPRNGMRLTEALRIAAQAADALTAAHAAGIVHRDVKPANIMVDTHGRVKVLDFGLAKSSPRAASPASVEGATHTLTVAQPQTEKGAILGSVPYMSPEQAEGKPLDARSDIFSFGAVLYEMITGQRAFRGESRASTLAAVVEKEPPPPSEIAATTPPELERLIARCLRKDVNRRSQSMADVKLALEELRDESESGKLMRSAAGAPAQATARRWLWPAVAGACVIVALAAVGWAYLRQRGAAQPQGPDLVRLSPDDGHYYLNPAISPDGKLVAYTSDRSGPEELWLQQVGGAEPIQLTHSGGAVEGAQFFPDGTRILYVAHAADSQKYSIEVIPTLGGRPKVLTSGDRMYGTALSPDARQVAYFQYLLEERRLMLVSSDGGRPRELPNWKRIQSRLNYETLTWTSDGRSLLVVELKRADAPNLDEWEWFALPVDGGEPVMTGAGEVLRAAGLEVSLPAIMFGERVLFNTEKGQSFNIWEVRLSPSSRRVAGAPRQLTFLTEEVSANSVSSTGVTALEISRAAKDIYLVPLDSRNGHAAGSTRRLTQDGRFKLLSPLGGEPGAAYFFQILRDRLYGYGMDLDSGKQTSLTPGLETGRAGVVLSRDGRQIAYSIADGDSYSIRVAETGTGPEDARILCKACGLAEMFSPDGRFLMYRPEARSKPGPNDRKLTVRLLELASGKDRPWLEHPSESVFASRWFGQDAAWVAIALSPVGSRRGQWKGLLVPWQEERIPVSQWIDAGIVATQCDPSPASNFAYCAEGGRLTALRFDPKTRTFSPPFEVKFVPGSAPEFKAENAGWQIRGPGLVFAHRETRGSAWLMKLPR